MRSLRNVDRLNSTPGPVPSGSTCDDAVVVSRIALGFHQSGSAAGGTTCPIRVHGRAFVISFRDCFRSHGHFMSSTIAEIDKLLRVSQGERGARTLVAKIAHDRGVAALHTGTQGC